jgi:hypothetical protein
MRLFSRGCDDLRRPYLAALDRADPRERIDLEAHARTCPECADALRNAGAVDEALRGAFASLRERRAQLAPGRVRLAVMPRPVQPNVWLRAPRFFGRLAEVSVMVGVTLFAVGGTFERPTSVTPEHRSVVQDYFRAQAPSDEIDYFRWLRLRNTDAAVIPSDPTRLPAGGRYDVDQPEIVKASSTPR